MPYVKHPPVKPDDRFGRLIVVSAAERGKRGLMRWNCLCACGASYAVYDFALKSGTQSCGCLRAVSNKSRAKHGMKNTPEYHSWTGMIGRCYNRNNGKYSDYGGRGITVCDQWRTSFEQFFADMGPRPSPQHSIDRIDNDGNYEPSNCRWATVAQQCRNRRNNHLLTINGETHCIDDWSTLAGLPPHTLHNRLRKGWPLERLLEPVKNQWKNKRARGELNYQQA
jgi:hypothetical protein